MSEPGAVSFTVKELLDRIERKVDSIDNKLELKADRERVHDLSTRLAALELHNAGNGHLLRQFADSQHDIEDLKVWRNRLIGAAALAGFLGAAALARALGVG